MSIKQKVYLISDIEIVSILSEFNFNYFSKSAADAGRLVVSQSLSHV